MESNGSVGDWAWLAGEAEAGRLRLDPAVEAECVAACDDLLTGLEDLERLARRAQRVDGFGDFVAGQQLAEFYALKATGGPDSIDAALEQHKQVVMLMKETIQAAVRRVVAQDGAVAGGIAAVQIPGA